MNNDIEILDPLPIQLSHGKLKKWFRLKNSRQWEEVLKLIEETQYLIHAKAIYKVSYAERTSATHVRSRRDVVYEPRVSG